MRRRFSTLRYYPGYRGVGTSFGSLAASSLTGSHTIVHVRREYVPSPNWLNLETVSSERSSYFPEAHMFVAWISSDFAARFLDSSVPSYKAVRE